MVLNECLNMDFIDLYSWLVVTGTWLSCFHSLGNVIIPTVTHSIMFQRGRAQPPTSIGIHHSWAIGIRETRTRRSRQLLTSARSRTWRRCPKVCAKVQRRGKHEETSEEHGSPKTNMSAYYIHVLLKSTKFIKLIASVVFVKVLRFATFLCRRFVLLLSILGPRKRRAITEVLDSPCDIHFPVVFFAKHLNWGFLSHGYPQKNIHL